MMEYNSIEHLEGMSHVRARPSMYCGNVEADGYNDATNNFLREVVGNSIDEVMGGHATTLKVTYDPDLNKIRVEDNGRGIPFSHNGKLDLNNLELAVGVTNSGAKFSKGDDCSFKYALGMHGLGIKLVNALSEDFWVTSIRDGKLAFISYEKGVKSGEVNISENDTDISHGTIVSWIPDPEILKFPKYKVRHLKKYLQEVAYLNAGLKIKLFILKEGSINQFEEEIEYCEPDGIQGYLKNLTEGRNPLANFPLIKAEEEDTGNKYEIAMSVLEGSSESIFPFVNGNQVETTSAPVVALRQAFARSVAGYIREYAELTKKEKSLDVQTNDIRSGICSVIKILHVDPAFDAQTKTKLINVDISQFISKSLPDKILGFLLTHKKEATKIVNQALIQATARIAAQKARQKVIKHERKKITELNISLDIFTPPLSNEPSKNKLYLFEGQSASGALVNACKNRNPVTKKLYKENIGILALKGIPLNPLEVKMERVLKNVELATLIKVGGLNPTNPDDLSGLNFNEFIIASDMDAGGQHITTLIITFFVTHFPEIIKKGKLFKVITPLFEVIDLKTKDLNFIYANENREDKLREFGYTPEEAGKGFTLKRNKGLGEQSSKANMTLVENPRLIKFQYEDIEKMKELFFIFSGKEYIKDRRALIFELGLIGD